MIFIELVKKTLELNLRKEEFLWLQTVLSTSAKERSLQIAFATVPKYIKKGNINLTKEILNEFKINVGFSPESWTRQQLVRVFILLHFKSRNEKKYTNILNEFFETAEINEQVALYSSLFFLHYPEHWLSHAKEAVRSNMGTVFDAIAFNNPYPFHYFDDLSWNQLILKTIFNGKDIQKIYGLKIRSNKELAYMISDFANERWSAGRSISPYVWELVEPFMDEHITNNIEKLFQTENNTKLFYTYSGFAPAKNILEQVTNLHQTNEK